MSLNNNKDSFTYELEYKATKKGKIKLIDSNFIYKNKNKCKIIYNGKEYDLMEYLKLDNNYNYNDPIKIQLRINNNIKDISYMFYECNELLSIRDNIFDNSNITNINKSFYENNSNNFYEKTDNLNETDKGNTFYDDNLALSTIPKNINNSSYTEMNELNIFREKILSNVTNMSGMFNGCSSLISLPDISKWDTKNVKDMNDMFCECSSLISLPDISKWDTTNATLIGHMFCECSSLLSLPDISKWGTKNIIDFMGMFEGCSSLISLPDISKWYTIYVTDGND